MKEEQYWLAAAEDFRRFRKGIGTMEDLQNRYPDFRIKESWFKHVGFEQAIQMTIPEDCPLQMIPALVHGAEQEPKDSNEVSYHIRIAYQPAWEAFTQWYQVRQMCETKDSYLFHICYREEGYRSNMGPYIEIRYCVHEGSHGDDDGYGVEDDTWLVALLKDDGTWLREWYIEE